MTGWAEPDKSHQLFEEGNHQTLFSGPIKGKVQNHQRPRFRKLKANKRKSNHQTPKVKADKKKSNHQTPKFWPNETKSKCKNNDKYCYLFEESNKLLNKVTNFLKKVIAKLSSSGPIKEKVQNHQNHQNPRFRVDKKKSNLQTKEVVPRLLDPIFRASKRNFYHQIPRFRTDKRKSYHRTPRFRANTSESKCKNNEEHCEQWSKLGDCDHKVYGSFMKKNCKLSCNLCTGYFIKGY